MLADVQMVLQILIWFLGIVLILLILVQGGSGDLSSTFGGGGQLDSTLGVGASRKMGKITGWLSFAFLMVVLVMAIPAGGSFAETGTGGSIGDDAEQLTPAPADDATSDLPLGAEDVELDDGTPPLVTGAEGDAPIADDAGSEMPVPSEDGAGTEVPALETVPDAVDEAPALEIDASIDAPVDSEAATDGEALELNVEAAVDAN